MQLDVEKCGLKGSPTQVVKVFSPEHRAGGERWEGDAPELAAKIVGDYYASASPRSSIYASQASLKKRLPSFA